jgi:hypothetical protein
MRTAQVNAETPRRKDAKSEEDTEREKRAITPREQAGCQPAIRRIANLRYGS